MITLGAAKGNFFDRAKVMNAVNKARRKVLSKMGAFVRTRARTSIRYKKRTSLPGKPPHAHKTQWRAKRNKKTGLEKVQAYSPLRDFILFSWDESRKSVVVGPVKLSRKSGGALPALEYGGVSMIKSWGKRRRASIRARPFMRPALRAEKSKFPALWAKSVR